MDSIDHTALRDQLMMVIMVETVIVTDQHVEILNTKQENSAMMETE